MILYPAIDMKDGKAVRLKQGRMEDSTIFADNPAAQARRFADAGARWLHLVDLNGAFEGKPVNRQVVSDILSVVHLPVQLGGGIRSMATLEYWLNNGIQRAILGTAAVKNPELVREACAAFPGRIAVGIDAKNGMVAVEGWAETSDLPAIELAKQFEDAGVSTVIYTDISRDGMMQGVNVEATLALAHAVTIPVIASGGVSSLDDLRALKKHEDEGIEGAIIGRALYDGAIDLSEALSLC